MDQVRDALFLPDDVPVDGSGVRIAVLDTGIDLDHPDLGDAISEESHNLCPLGRDVLDRVGHGTHVAGIIAGDGKASDGRYRGIAPGAEIIALKVLTDGSGYSDTLAKGVLEAIDLGVDIINYSGGHDGSRVGRAPWKWPQSLDFRDKAFQQACDQGILCVAAAGNQGPRPGSINKPGLLNNVLCVGSLTTDGETLAEDSSRGPVYLDPELPKGSVDRAEPDYGDEPVDDRTKPNLVAPGGSEFTSENEARVIARRLSLPEGPVSCRSSHTERLVGIDPSDPDCSYTRVSGSSQATAVVSGLAALAIEYGRKRGVDWAAGGSAGQALHRLLTASASTLRGYLSEEIGAGAITWINLAANVEAIGENDTFKERIFYGPQIELVR